MKRNKNMHVCQPDVFLLVLISDFDVVSSQLQLVMLHFAKDLKVGGEKQLETTLLQVVVPVKTSKHKSTHTHTHWFNPILEVNPG